MKQELLLIAEKKKHKIYLELKTNLNKSDLSQILLLASEMIHTNFKKCQSGSKFIIPIEVQEV